MESEKAKVSVTDFSEYYNNKIALCLETIYELQYTIEQFPIRVYDINQELHQIFKMISAKIHKKDRTKQLAYQQALQKIQPVIYEKRQAPNQSAIMKVPVKTEQFKKYVQLCELRELHIWKCLEQLGLTTKSKVGDKIVG